MFVIASGVMLSNLLKTVDKALGSFTTLLSGMVDCTVSVRLVTFERGLFFGIGPVPILPVLVSTKSERTFTFSG